MTSPFTSRRDFLKQGGAALGATALAGSALNAMPGLLSTAPAPLGRAVDTFADIPMVKEIMAAALNAAKLAGASYADVRCSRQRQNFVQTREQQITNIVDTDTIGLGVRTLVDGTWGFAATRVLSTDGAAAAAKEAVAIARASRIARDKSVEWLPSPTFSDVKWKSAYTKDPWDVPIEEKADLLLKANAAALKAKGVKFVFSGFFFVKDERNYANTDGSVISQDVIRSWPLMQITAVSADFSDFQNRGNVVAPMARGWEYVLGSDLVGNAQKWGEEAAAKLTAKPVEVGRYDLVLDPANLWLTIHESIAHPTELDRAMGYEANYAGTSFVAPPEKMLGQLKYGPSMLNIQGDRSQEGGLSTIGWDDDGVKPDEFLIIKDGMFNDYQTTREQAPWLRWWYEKNGRPVRSHGCAYAQGWDNVQFQRMPNVSLLPGEKDLKIADLVSATDRGILISGDGSFSIDQQRYNAQFGGQTFHEIKGGKIVGVLKDVAYQIRTPDFWNSLDMIGGKSSYTLGGSFFDGKGQPPQVNAVSHGSPPARFRNVNIINTGEEGLMSADKTFSELNRKREALSRRVLLTDPAESFRRGVPLREAANAAVLSREEAQAIVEKAVRLSKADGIDVQVNTYYNGNVRFAANQVSTSGATTDAQLAIQSTFGPKHAVVTTNDLSDEAIRRCVEQSERMAKLAPDDPEVMPALGAQSYTPVKAFFDATANLTPEDRARAALVALQMTRSAGDLKSAGYLVTGMGASAIGNKAGMFAYRPATSSNYSLTVRSDDGTGSGWAAADHPDWSQMDARRVAQRATDKARLSRNPVAIEPGRYTVILEPQAVGDLVQLIANYADARATDEGRSPFVKQGGGNKLGEKIVDERVTLLSDPTDPQLLGQPYDGEGMPIGRQVWIENGVLKQLYYSRFWAKKQNKTATGAPTTLKMAGGTQTVDELVAGTTRGILVTRLWYLREVDPRTILYTGLTRDGTFLIENGKITKSLRNFRFNESPLFMLNNLEALGRTERLAGTEQGGDVAMPAIKARDFNFTSLSEAV